MLPDNVHELPSRRPETQVLEAHGVAIHGQSFATRAVADDLAAGYPPPVRGLFNVGLLHTCAQGRPGHEFYAPCAIETLVDRGYDYWALGHIHTREVLARDPWVVFPGNLQGRHARETGPKGATVVTVQDGRITAVEARALDVVRWTVCEVDAPAAGSADDAIEAARDVLVRAVADADGRLVAAPVTFRVGAAVHRALRADDEHWTQQLRAVALDVVGDGLWIERVRFVCVDPDADVASLPEDAVAQFVRAVKDLREDDEAVARLSGELEDLRRKLPSEVREGEDALRLDDPETLRRLLDEARALVVGRLGVTATPIASEVRGGGDA